jgi:L-ascorbate metabolism protein UlaG (beta-lactamase superfamily)
MSISFRWLGHSAFTVTVDGSTILIDPFLSGNPLAAADPATINADLIVLSHAHGDHVGDTVDIAKRTGAPVVCNFEIGNWLYNQGVENVVQTNTGGTYDAGFVRVKYTMAFHSSSLPDGTYGGQPQGFILKTQEGKNLYFAGDTSLFGDMRLIGEEGKGIELAFLPIGDHFTMGMDDSIKAISFIRPRFVTPMHYNTFPPIVQNASEWAQRVNTETQATPVVLDPGGEYTIS